LDAEAPLGHHVETATAKFVWFGTTHLFDGLTFVHRVSEHGNFAAHAYPISGELSTFIVETDEETWRRAGLDRFDVTQPPGVSDTDTQKYLETLFADDVGGGVLVANNSRWANFRTRRTDHWWRDNVALLGDAVHTAHFSVGSGTKMAMEDAVVLAEELAALSSGVKSLTEALSDYQQRRQIPVGKIQRAARPSLSWWEHFGTYQRALDPLTFAFHFFSRSIGIDRIAQRDPELVNEVRDAWRHRYGQSALATPVDLVTDNGAVKTSRRLVIRSADGGLADLVDEDGRVVTVPAVQVPENGDNITEAVGQLPTSGTVVVVGPASLARTLLAEEARLRRGLVTIVAGSEVVDDVTVETVLLAGRADAMAEPSELAGSGEVAR